MSEIRTCEVCGEEFCLTHLKCGECASDLLCDVDALTAENARLRSLIQRMAEVGDEMAKSSFPFTRPEEIETGSFCVCCHKGRKFGHDNDCPVTKWAQIKKEMEG